MTIENVEMKLVELSHKVQALEQENTVLKRDMGILEESIESLVGHGIDVDYQLDELRVSLKENAIRANVKAPTKKVREWGTCREAYIIDATTVSNNR